MSDRASPRGRRIRRRLALPLASAATLVALIGLAAEPAGARPNIIVVTTDDQELASLSRATMPNVARLLQRQGTTFTNYVASGPLCCPARAVFLTGQYGHNNGVTWNVPGYPDLREEGNTLPVWLRQGGYRTAHVGKYLNGYQRAVGNPDRVPPGWNEWHTMIEPMRYYDYILRVNGRRVRYGDRPRDYFTRVMNRTAVRLINRYVPRRAPLFMSIDQFAPHGAPSRHPRCAGTAVPDPSDEHLFRTAGLPRPPSFNEAGILDKPSYISTRPLLSRAARATVTRRYRCRLASLRAVDRGVGMIHRALRRQGELGNTVIVFTSDNGWFSGQHRIPKDKWFPYEEGYRVPLIVRAPTVIAGPRASRRTDLPAVNIDVAPTILRLARARPCTASGRCRTLDGRSLVRILRGRTAGWPANRGALLELEVPSQRAAAHTSCDFEGIRARGHVYLEHHSFTSRAQGSCQPREETEHYDLRDDPFQLRNLSPAAPSSPAGQRQAALAARLADLEDCAGVAGRDPRTLGRAFCE